MVLDLVVGKSSSQFEDGKEVSRNTLPSMITLNSWRLIVIGDVAWRSISLCHDLARHRGKRGLFVSKKQ